MYVWGSATDNKLGIDKKGINLSTVDEPFLTDFRAKKVAFKTEIGTSAIRYQLQHYDKNKFQKIQSDDAHKDAKRIGEAVGIKQITWGESHCVIVDKKGRVFSMGSSLNGRLGLPDTKIADVVKLPTQITLGLPQPSSGSKIIHVTAGVAHTVAVTRSGDLYSWGDGSQQRLGLGYIEETRSTPNQETPYQIQNVFDTKAVLTISCGRT